MGVSLLTLKIALSLLRRIIDTSYGSVAIYFLALGEPKKATYICKRLFPRLELTTSESNLSSKNRLSIQENKNTKQRTEQSETTALSFKADPKGEITNRVKTGGVGFKILFLAHQNCL
jgi:acyl CoA:acetate/3-ketoacid CoA transferase alpha subunit